jgi:hypothetical protein
VSSTVATAGAQLTLIEAAKVLKISRARMRQLEEDGRLVPVARGPRNTRMYGVDAVLAFREQRIQARLQTVTRIVEPTLEFSEIRNAVVRDLARIVHRAARVRVDVDGKVWTAAARCAAVIVDATTPTTTTTRTVEATQREGAAATAAALAKLLEPGEDEAAPEYTRQEEVST